MKTIGKKVLSVLAGLLFIALCAALGLLCAYVLFRSGLFELIASLPKAARAGALVWFAAAYFLCSFAGIALHEAGHLVFGLRSGYRFVSYRLGSMLWRRENGRLVRRRFSLAGTGGQCLMAPPGGYDEPFPQALYNLGGVIANLAAVALLGALSCLPVVRRSPILLPLTLFGAFNNFAMALSNGLPVTLGPVPNDGWNALHLAGDAEARRAFWVMLTVNAKQYEGVRLRDMPAEWFALPSEEAMKNGLTATLAVLAENRAMDVPDFAAAEALFPVIRDEKCRAAELYKRLLVCDAVYCALLREGAAADVKALEERKTAAVLRQMKEFPSVLRTRYAVELLKNRDEAAAAKVLERFEKAAAAYPAPADTASERDLIALARQKFEQSP